MAYTVVNPRIGVQPIAVSSAIKNHGLGLIIQGLDPTYGNGEFIYLLGVAATLAGSVVTYNGIAAGVPTFQTTLAPSTAGLGYAGHESAS